MHRRRFAITVLLWAGCASPTDISYEERVEAYREQHGPFSACDTLETPSCVGTEPGLACLATAVSSCQRFEHVYWDDDETVTTFITPTDGGCEIIVFRDDGPNALDGRYQRERCESVEIAAGPSCIDFRGCQVQERWKEE